MQPLEQIGKAAGIRRQQGVGGAARVTQAAGSAVNVTPSDSTVINNMLFLVVTGAGNLALEFPDGSTVTFAVGAGTRWDVTATKVKAATTATGIVAFLAGA